MLVDLLEGKAFDVGLRGEMVFSGRSIKEAPGKSLGPEFGEAGIVNSGGIGAGFWVILGESVMLVEPSVRLGSVGSGNIEVG
jgi:hypothetical protein